MKWLEILKLIIVLWPVIEDFLKSLTDDDKVIAKKVVANAVESSEKIDDGNKDFVINTAAKIIG